MEMRDRVGYIAMLGFLLLAATFTNFLARASERERAPSRAPLLELPDHLGEWRTAETQMLDAATLAVLKPDDYLSRTYTNEQRTPVSLFIGYYRSQRNGQTYHSPQNCLPGAGWAMLRQARLQVGNGRGQMSEINHYLVAKDGEKMVALYWYQARGRVVASEYWGKIYTVRDAISRQRTDGALVRVMLPVDEKEGGEPRALADGVSFVRELMPALPRYIPD